jgi:signal transduction histidine kinase
LTYGELQVALSQAAEQQRAAADVLRIIASSPTDLRSVLKTVIANAVRLAGGEQGHIRQYDGEYLQVVAQFNESDDFVRAIKAIPVGATQESAVGRAFLTQRPVHIPDILADSAYRGPALPLRGRTVLAVPLLQEGAAIGTISMWRREVEPFTERQIELVMSFADQAVIAIEHARLLTELREKNRAVTASHAQLIDALAQQTATSEVLRVISRSPTDVQPVFDAIARSAVRLCDARFCAVYRFDGELLHLAAHDNFSAEALVVLQGVFPRRPDQVSHIGRAVREGVVVNLPDVAGTGDAPPGSHRHVARLAGYRGFLAVPIVREGEAVGCIALGHEAAAPFPEGQVSLVTTFAAQAVIAIENVRLFKELERNNVTLTEMLEQQTATAEILRVISSSPRDVQPVFDAIVASAQALSGVGTSAVFLIGDDLVTVAAADGVSPVWRAQYPRPITPDTVIGRAALERRTVHTEDLETDPAYKAAPGRLIGVRTILGVPMLKDGEPVGVIAVWRWEVKPFSAQQIALLQTFAAQAVIAIDNARLFAELQARNVELTEALAQQKATGRILAVISSSPTDLRPVFQTILDSATHLCDAHLGGMFSYEDGMVHALAIKTESGAIPEFWSRPYQPTPSSGIGRALAMRRTVHIADITEDEAYRAGDPQRLRTVEQLRARTCLWIPFVKQESVLGVAAIYRREVRPFTDQQIALLETFADQAVIAIENVRLFTELESANRELDAASRHKSEFLASMSHELRTPLNAIIGFSEVLRDRMFGDVNEKQEEYLNDIHGSGQHLLSLINDILDLSKIEAGRMELDVSDFHLSATLDNALTLIRERAGRRGVALHMTVDGQVEYIRADERKIRQVVLNLLSNAIKFTPEGGRIEIRAVAGDEAVAVSVADTGVGIAPEDQQAIFEEFRQVGTASKKVEGTGLGLALSRKFVELHGGRIWVQSQVGSGSTFTFTIPRR